MCTRFSRPAGLQEGSIALWDLRESSLMHSALGALSAVVHRRICLLSTAASSSGESCVLRHVTFTTDDMTRENHEAPVRRIVPLSAPAAVRPSLLSARTESDHSCHSCVGVEFIRHSESDDHSGKQDDFPDGVARRARRRNHLDRHRAQRGKRAHLSLTRITHRELRRPIAGRFERI